MILTFYESLYLEAHEMSKSLNHSYAWGSIETVTIGKTHPTLQNRNKIINIPGVTNGVPSIIGS